MKFTFTMTITVLLFLASYPAQAKHRHHHYRSHHIARVHVATVTPYVHCDDRYPASCGVTGRVIPDRRTRIASDDSERIVSHPNGCPARQFCGCGASVKIFGHPVRELFLASNWFKFPRASPGPGMAAVRNHHVMVILAYDGNGNATVYDANSGGHQTRIHVRSLAGYRVVNPHGSVMAMQ